jgi:hypothetical protein
MNYLGSVTLLFAFAVSTALAQEPGVENGSDREQRFAYIHEQLNALELRLAKNAEEPLRLTAEPVLKYTNPVRSADGVAASYLWLRNNRPVAAACLAIRQEDKVWRELASLTDDSLSLTKDGAALWTPTTQVQASRLFPKAPDPADSPAQRLIQMRSLARKFQVQIFRDPPIAARLLPQPIHRYADEKGPLLDGALFAWVETTDPEALLAIEALPEKKDAPPRWHYRFARMTSAGIEARLEDAIVFKVESYWRNPRAKTDAYQEAQQIRYGALPPVAK